RWGKLFWLHTFIDGLVRTERGLATCSGPTSVRPCRGATRCLRRMPIIDGHRCDCLRRSCREAGLLPRVELFERIRRDKRLEPGVGQRELARRHGVHRRTVRLALGRAVPPERKPPVRVRLAGETVACHQFTLRLSYAGKAVHRLFASQSQESFMQGHAEAFRVLGGVPTRHIRYDNLKPAVHQVCFGRSRIESQRWTAFRSHYGFDAFYCIPGEEGAHEKGGVEHEGGRFRRNHLVPVVAVDTLAELNERLAEIDKAEDDRHIQGANTSIGFNFANEAELLAPLPDDEFDCGITLTPTVRRDSRIVVRQNYYSVPARFIGGLVRVSLRGNELVVFERNRVVARHERLTHRWHYRDNLDHYLEILKIKPGALAGSTALAQARAAGVLTTVHDAFWQAAKAAHGDAEGTRALVEVLLLHRRMPAAAVLAGIAVTLQAGSTSPDLVAIDARKAASAAEPDPLTGDTPAEPP